MSGIFDDDEKTTLSALEPFAMAVRLKEIVQKKLKHLAPVRAAAWSEELRKLVRETGGDPIRVERVLDWYDDYCLRPGSFRCINAYIFRKMFYMLEANYEKEAKQKVTPCDDSITIAANLRIAARWHGGSDKRLDSAVKRSLDAYIAFKKKLLLTPPDEELDRFLQWISPEMIRDPVDFVYGWFMTEHRKVRTWTTWNGNLEPLVFSEGNERLAYWGSDLAASYGDRRLWDRLIESTKGVKV